MFEFGDDFMDAGDDLFPAVPLGCPGEAVSTHIGDGVWAVDAGALRVIDVSFFASTTAQIGVSYRFDATRFTNSR